MRIFKISFTLVLTLVLMLVGAIFIFQQKLISVLILPPYIEWATETEAKGVAKGVALDEKQLLIAREIGLRQPEKVRLVYVDAVPFPYDNLLLKTVGEAVGFIGDGIINNAQVFGYAIYVRKDYPLTTAKLAHELVHVLQIERSTLAQVISQHFTDMLTYGYADSPLEIEAFKANERFRDR